MTITIKPKTKGDRLNLRISTKMRYGLELLARKEGKTISALFEEVAASLLVDRLTKLRKKPGARKMEEVSILDETWDILDADRLVKLAQLAPDYLSDRDRTIWKVICEHPGYWRDEARQIPDMGAIRDNWDAIEQQAEKYLDKHGSRT